MSLPLVSIVIPSYKPAFFEQCLCSAIRQTYPNIEILVSDNCPSEEIRDICAKYSGVQYQRSPVFRHENVLASFLSGTGTFIKPLFDDDLLHHLCVERMVDCMLNVDNVELVYSASCVIDATNQRIEDRQPFPQSGSLSGHELEQYMATNFYNPVGECSTILFKRETLLSLGTDRIFCYGETDCTRGLGDVVLWWKLARRGLAYYLDEELSYFRQDKTLESNSNQLTNPDYSYCLSDWIDLLIESHRAGITSTEALLGKGGRNVAAYTVTATTLWPRIQDSIDRFDAYVTQVKRVLE